MFKSGCLVRTAHVILTWLTTLVLFLHNTGKCNYLMNVYALSYLNHLLLKHHLNTMVCEFVHEIHADLRRCQQRGDLVQPMIFSSLVLLSVLLYFTVSLMDPGFVRSDKDAKVFKIN